MPQFQKKPGSMNCPDLFFHISAFFRSFGLIQPYKNQMRYKYVISFCKIFVFLLLLPMQMNAQKWGDPGKTRVLNLSRKTLDSSQIQNLSGYSQLVSLNLSNTNLDDEGFKAVSSLKKLQVLNISYTYITDASIPQINNLPNLRSLNMEGTDITNQGLDSLQENKITSLSIGRSKINSHGMSSLGRFNRLWSLDLTSLPVSNMAAIGKLRNLRELNLWNTKVDDTAISQLASLENLNNLTLGGTPITNKSLKFVKKWKKLKFLNLSNTSVGNSGLAKIGNHKSLEAIGLNHTRVSGPGISSLASIANLKILGIAGIKPGHTFSSALKNLKNLKVVYIDKNSFAEKTLLKLKQKHPFISFIISE